MNEVYPAIYTQENINQVLDKEKINHIKYKLDLFKKELSHYQKPDCQ